MMPSMNTTASKKKDEPPVAANGNHNYFAIASMMNPTSLKGREITPIRSQPAVLVDYKLRFFGTMGYAEAVACPGYRGFHGVVHTVSEHDMKILNDIEHIYTPTIATAELYNGETISVTVYCGSKENEEINDRMPQERYLDIMIEGAQHFGVKQEYIDSLRSLEYEPRPKPEDFLSFGSTTSNVPTMSLNEVMKQDGEDGRPLYAIVNGKVLEIVNPTPERSGLFRMLRHKLHTAVIEDFLPKIVYDPLYGIPECRKDCTQEHSAYMEHLTVQRLGKDGCVVVGRLVD